MAGLQHQREHEEAREGDRPDRNQVGDLLADARTGGAGAAGGGGGDAADPIVTSVKPRQSAVVGGVRLTIDGRNFDAQSTVSFGGVEGEQVGHVTTAEYGSQMLALGGEQPLVRMTVDGIGTWVPGERVGVIGRL